MFLFDQIVANLNNLNFLICIQVNKSNQNLQTYKNELQNLSKKVKLNKNSKLSNDALGLRDPPSQEGNTKTVYFYRLWLCLFVHCFFHFPTILNPKTPFPIIYQKSSIKFTHFYPIKSGFCHSILRLKRELFFSSVSL